MMIQNWEYLKGEVLGASFQISLVFLIVTHTSTLALVNNNNKNNIQD